MKVVPVLGKLSSQYNIWNKHFCWSHNTLITTFDEVILRFAYFLHKPMAIFPKHGLLSPELYLIYCALHRRWVLIFSNTLCTIWWTLNGLKHYNIFLKFLSIFVIALIVLFFYDNLIAYQKFWWWWCSTMLKTFSNMVLINVFAHFISISTRHM